MNDDLPKINDDISADALLKTLLVTDLVGSTKLIEELGDARAYKVAAQHDRVARDLVADFEGREINKTDGFLLLFDRPIDALGYALAYHQALARLSEELGVELQARAGIHVGEVLLRRTPPEDVARGAQPLEVEGIAKPVAARVMSLARGRQTLLTRSAFEFARRAAVGRDLSGSSVSWIRHGSYRFKGVDEPMEIFEVGREGFAPLSRPPSSEKVYRIEDNADTLRPAVVTANRAPRQPLPVPRNRNPFFHRQGISDPHYFFGRADLVRSLLEMVASAQSCAVVGERRIGKSSLLAYLAHPRVQAAHHLETARTLTVFLDFLALHSCSPEELLKEICETMELAAQEGEALALLRQMPDFTFTELRRCLRKLKRLGYLVVLLCDEFELAVKNPSFDLSFFGALRALASEGVAFVTASRLNLLELEQYQSEEVREKVLGSPFFNIFAEFRVGPLEDHEVAELLAASLDPTPVRFEHEDMDFLGCIAGRHPYFLQLAAYHLYAVRERARRSSSTNVLEPFDEGHAKVRAEVRREAAKIFRNQWQHSTRPERRALAALALTTREAVEPALPSGVDAHHLVRLERRGLVRQRGGRNRRTEYPGRDVARLLRDGESLRNFQLFSEILTEWILANVTSTIDGLSQAENLTFAPSAAARMASSLTAQRYTTLEEIGRGGTGTVYKAWDEQLERVVALKVLDPAIRSSPVHLERLLGEVRTCAGLHHPHIVEIHDIDIKNAVLVHEFLAGGSLRDLLEAVPVLGDEDLLNLAYQLIEALGAAHQAGVVHRDLKPENVLLTSRPAIHAAGRGQVLPSVKLGDFGTALRLKDLDKVGERHSMAGTLAYMAPEQMSGEGVGPAADFYSFGVMLFEARHGERPPAVGARDAARARAAVKGGAAPLDATIVRCLSEKPRDRFQDAETLLDTLRVDKLQSRDTAGPEPC